jgi:hypothetical protein
MFRAAGAETLNVVFRRQGDLHSWKVRRKLGTSVGMVVTDGQWRASTSVESTELLTMGSGGRYGQLARIATSSARLAQ